MIVCLDILLPCNFRNPNSYCASIALLFQGGREAKTASELQKTCGSYQNSSVMIERTAKAVTLALAQVFRPSPKAEIVASKGSLEIRGASINHVPQKNRVGFPNLCSESVLSLAPSRARVFS